MAKVIDWIKNHKLLLLVSGLFIVAVIFVFVFQKKKVSIPITPTPKPAKFQLLKTFPQEGVQETSFPTTAIQFSFSKPLNKSATRAEIFPQEKIEVVFANNDQDVFVKPLPFWKLGTSYKIVLYVKSGEGETLNPINFSFQFNSPKNSNMDERPL